MKQLKNMKETLVSATQAQLANLSSANTEELGCAIDMIKDLSEAIYYCSIVKAMDEAEDKEEKTNTHQTNGYYMPQSPMYFQERIREPYQYPYYPDRDMDRDNRRMYYPESSSTNHGHSRENDHTQQSANRDAREGRSAMSRKTYMESRSNGDRSMHLKELERYLQELSSDITEMIQGASPEEKQLLQKKLAMLANKIPDA